MTTKPGIPSIPRNDPLRTRFDTAIKERLEIIGGDRGDIIQPLSLDATLPQAIAKLNEIIALLQ
jgi:hypothetical protein